MLKINKLSWLNCLTSIGILNEKKFLKTCLNFLNLLTFFYEWINMTILIVWFHFYQLDSYWYLKQLLNHTKCIKRGNKMTFLNYGGLMLDMPVWLLFKFLDLSKYFPMFTRGNWHFQLKVKFWRSLCSV